MVTLLLSFVMMVALFLLLYAAVALVQDKRFFTTAPKDIQERYWITSRALQVRRYWDYC